MTVLLALVCLAACGEEGDSGTEAAETTAGEVASQPAETTAGPARLDADDPGAEPEPGGPAPGTAIAAGEEPVADTAAGDSAAADTLAGPGPPLRIPGGTEITVTSDYDISTDVYDVGDPVIATVVQEVMDRDGTVLIPRGVKLLGRVEAATGSGGVGEPPVLEVSFETLSAWRFERPIETLVTHTPVTLDPEADRERRQATGRDALRVLPGRITAGSIIMLQLREPVFVGDRRNTAMWLPGDSLGGEWWSGRWGSRGQPAARGQYCRCPCWSDAR